MDHGIHKHQLKPRNQVNKLVEVTTLGQHGLLHLPPPPRPNFSVVKMEKYVKKHYLVKILQMVLQTHQWNTNVCFHVILLNNFCIHQTNNDFDDHAKSQKKHLSCVRAMFVSMIDSEVVDQSLANGKEIYFYGIWYIPLPIGSMYGIFTYIWLKHMVNRGKYTVRPMDPSWTFCNFRVNHGESRNFTTWINSHWNPQKQGGWNFRYPPVNKHSWLEYPHF